MSGTQGLIAGVSRLGSNLFQVVKLSAYLAPGLQVFFFTRR